MEKPISVTVGFDQLEAIAYHVFCQSIVDTSSSPVAFVPLVYKTLCNLVGERVDGSNKFIYTRFLTPFLHDFSGWSIYCDGDMVCRSDITRLWSLRDPKYAVLVAKHDYKTKASTKYLGNKNENYPRKNWSSLILWNNEHPSNKCLVPDFIQRKDGAFLHRFSWLKDDEIGELPLLWNWLAEEYEPQNDAHLIHYTLGTPCFTEYRNCELSDYWHQSYARLKQGYQADSAE